jgi:chromosome segregation ATPase
MVQPAPPTNEPSKTMVKELQQAKVDALNARTSESMAQRKLADAEADLKQAKEEAAQATKEAEQAKMDAQKARESRAQAENKLAAAEAARVAAEGREEACQNDAKTQPGFGERLRSWFGRKPSNP